MIDVSRLRSDSTRRLGVVSDASARGSFRNLFATCLQRHLSELRSRIRELWIWKKWEKGLFSLGENYQGIIEVVNNSTFGRKLHLGKPCVSLSSPPAPIATNPGEGNAFGGVLSV
jgi:hypothetical protein